jgi:hypothetical protein
LDTYRAVVYVHILSSIFLVGLALFWFIMNVALRRKFDDVQTAAWFQVLNTARWPHVAVPWKLRLPLPVFTWVVLVLLLATGMSALRIRGAVPPGSLWDVKLLLLAGVASLQVLATFRPRAALINLNMALVLVLMVVSGWMVR